MKNRRAAQRPPALEGKAPTRGISGSQKAVSFVSSVSIVSRRLAKLSQARLASAPRHASSPWHGTRKVLDEPPPPAQNLDGSKN